MDDIRSKVFNALDEVVYETDATKEQLEEAIKWFMDHYFDEDEEEE